MPESISGSSTAGVDGCVGGLLGDGSSIGLEVDVLEGRLLTAFFFGADFFLAAFFFGADFLRAVLFAAFLAGRRRVAAFLVLLFGVAFFLVVRLAAFFAGRLLDAVFLLAFFLVAVFLAAFLRAGLPFFFAAIHWVFVVNDKGRKSSDDEITMNEF